MSPCQNADDAKMSSYLNVLVPECPRFRNVQMPENLPAKSYTCQNGHGIKMFVPKCLAKIQGAKIIPSRKKLFAYGYPPLSMVLLQIAPDWNPYQVLHRWLPSCVQLGSGLLAYQQSTVKQDADGGSLQDKAQILWRLKAEGVVGFYGQKSPSDKGTSAYLHRMISLFFAPLFLLNRYGISNSTS